MHNLAVNPVLDVEMGMSFDASSGRVTISNRRVYRVTGNTMQQNKKK